MIPPYQLPARSGTSAGALPRLRAFLTRTWRGRLLLAALGVWGLGALGLRLPGAGLATLVLWAYAIWAAIRVLRWLVRRLLYKIRTKLIVSYLFIAVVPVVLLTAFFLLAGLLGMSLVASYMVTSSLDRTARELRTIARTAQAGLDPSAPTAQLEARLREVRALYPGLSFALVEKGRLVASEGSAPQRLPEWLKERGFAGAVRSTESGRPHVLRGIWSGGDGSFLVLDVPIDEHLFSALEEETGLHVFGREHPSASGMGITITEEATRRPAARAVPPAGTRGLNAVAVLVLTKWETGETDLEPLALRVQPRTLLARLSPTAAKSVQISEVLVTVLGVVGVVFLVMYAVALLIGLLLARSITGKVHALSEGTERLRHGDFDHPIRVRGKDQLGELAESFNMMARGIQDLLREQAEKQRLEEELRIARQIQMSLLPQASVTLPGLRVAALCLPAAEVGGDYYDLLPLSETRMGVLVADVSGKGTSAALYMAELKGLVLSLSRIHQSPARLLSEANRILAATMDPRSFITMTYAVVDTEARTMRYARAGHNPIIQLQAGTGRTSVLVPQGLGLGLDPGDRFEEILEEAEVPLRSGDVFLFFTDGLSEAMNERSELFGEQRLRDLIESAQGDEATLRDRIIEEIRRFAGGAAQHDDMTLVILRVV